MIPDLPVLKLGLAGFTAEQRSVVERVLQAAAGDTVTWEPADVDAADALWLQGARTQLVGTDRIRVVAAEPSNHALEFHLGDVDRPIAFALPVPPGVEPLCTFDFASGAAMARVLQQFDTWLAPVVAQFCLASYIVEHESALGTGKFELRLGTQPLAFVDMRGEAAVRATALPADFDGAAWARCAQERAVPEDFVRTSLSQLMWQYVTRTHRDLLPQRYRTGRLYFRRAPRLPQRLVKDVHLFILRELMLAPATFAQLQQRCGLGEKRMAHELAALYFVGSITSNPKRAARARPRGEAGVASGLPSHFTAPGSAGSPRARLHAMNPDLTLPAPMQPDH